MEENITESIRRYNQWMNQMINRLWLMNKATNIQTNRKFCFAKLLLLVAVDEEEEEEKEVKRLLFVHQK